MVPFFNGVLGITLTFWLGIHHYGFEWSQMAWTIAGAWLGAIVSPLVTLELERIPAIKRTLLRGWPGTWLLLLVVYNGSILAFSPHLRDLKTYLIFWIPVTLTTGWVIGPIFGRIRDAMVAARQRRELQGSRSKEPVL